MIEENREQENEQEENLPRIMIEFAGTDSAVCRVTPSSGVSLAQLELAAFRLETLARRAANDRYTMEVQQAMKQQLELQSIMQSGVLKPQ